MHVRTRDMVISIPSFHKELVHTHTHTHTVHHEQFETNIHRTVSSIITLVGSFSSLGKFLYQIILKLDYVEL